MESGRRVEGGLHTLALPALAAVVWRGRGFVQLMAVAAVLAAAASVPVDALARHRCRLGLAVLIVLGGATAIAAGLIAATAPMVADQVHSFADSVPDLIDRVRGSSAFVWLDGISIGSDRDPRCCVSRPERWQVPS